MSSLELTPSLQWPYVMSPRHLKLAYILNSYRKRQPCSGFTDCLKKYHGWYWKRKEKKLQMDLLRSVDLEVGTAGNCITFQKVSGVNKLQDANCDDSAKKICILTSSDGIGLSIGMYFIKKVKI